MLKQPSVVQLNTRTVPGKNVDEIQPFACPSIPKHKATHFFYVLPALLSGLEKVCIFFVVHRTGRSAMHGKWFSV